MALISFGEHTHPPPPPRKIPDKVKKQLTKIFTEFNLTDVTARRLLASPLLPIMLNGKTTLSSQHIALTNLDAINHLIRKERKRQFPGGTDILGVQHMMTNPLYDPYIRTAYQFDNGGFIVLCQFAMQSELLFSCSEIQADKTFRRTKCNEFEINSYHHSTNRIITLARVWFEADDMDGYYEAFRLVFNTAEKDVGRPLRWGHLLSEKELDKPYIKAVLVDEHGGQVKGLGKYLEEKHSKFKSEDHIRRIVKVCQTHYYRSINKLEKANLSNGNGHYKQEVNE